MMTYSAQKIKKISFLQHPRPPHTLLKKKVLHAQKKEQVDPASQEESEVEDGNEEQLEDEHDEEEEMSDDYYLDEEPTKFSSLKEYYQQASEGKTTLETLLIMFCRHLQDINGGACNEKQAMLHEALDPKGQDKDIESLVKDGGTFIWRNWAKPLLDSKKKRHGTIRSYFCSVAKFCEFIIDNTEHEVDMKGEQVQKCHLMIIGFITPCRRVITSYRSFIGSCRQYSNITLRHLGLRAAPRRGWTGMLFDIFALSIWRKDCYLLRGRNLSSIFHILTQLSSRNGLRRTEKSQRK